jgi:hypothetical protein
MLKWLPEERATAKELLEDPYLSYESPKDKKFVVQVKKPDKQKTKKNTKLVW